MICPYCRGESWVVTSRWAKQTNRVYRRRECKRCKKRWSTHESVTMPEHHATASVVRYEHANN